MTSPTSPDSPTPDSPIPAESVASPKTPAETSMDATGQAEGHSTWAVPTGQQAVLASPASGKNAWRTRLVSGGVGAVVAAIVVSGAAVALSHYDRDGRPDAATFDRMASGEQDGNRQPDRDGRRFQGDKPVAGEQHIRGTLTSVSSSSVAVKSSSGTTATYALTDSTQIMGDGAVVSVSQLKIGDAVVVHVYPLNDGSMQVERIIAGQLPDGHRSP